VVAQPETSVAAAERHVRECEARVADQWQFVNHLNANGHHKAETRARAVLALFVDVLDATRRHLESEATRVAGPG
jgi:hypothetical protein